MTLDDLMWTILFLRVITGRHNTSNLLLLEKGALAHLALE